MKLVLPKIFLPLLVLGLGACSSSKEDPEDYFGLYEEASAKLTDENNNNIGISTSGIRLLPTQGSDSISLDPLKFDFRIGGIHSNTLDEMNLSFQLFDSKIYLPIEGFGSLPLGVKKINSYLDKGVFYTDWHNDKLLAKTFQTIIRKNIEGNESWTFPSSYRGFVPLSEDIIPFLEAGLPISDSLSFLGSDIDSLKDYYALYPEDVSFMKEKGVYTITLDSTHPEYFTDDFPLSSSSEGEGRLTKATLSYTFTKDCLQKRSFNYVFSSDTQSYTLSGDLLFAIGEEASPLQMSEEEKALYEEMEPISIDFSSEDFSSLPFFLEED